MWVSVCVRMWVNVIMTFIHKESWMFVMMSVCVIGLSRGCQSPVHENGVRHTNEKSTSVYRGKAQTYREVAARGTPVYFRENLSENLGLPWKLKVWGLQWKLENLSVTGTPVKTRKRESLYFLTGFTEVNGSPARCHLCVCYLYVCALPLYTEVDFSLSTSTWRTPFSWTRLCHKDIYMCTMTHYQCVIMS